MRIASLIFWVLAGVGVLLWVGWYFSVHAMACFIGTGGDACDVPSPADIGWDGFVILILLPAAAIAVLAFIAHRLGRAAKRRDARASGD